MFKLDNDFLQSLGLGGLPVEEKNRLLQMIYERLEMNVGMRLAEKMSDQQLDEFEGFIDRNDEPGALKWLETNFPNYKDVVAEELEKLKVEVQTAAPQILAAHSAGGQQMPPIGQPPIMPGVPPMQQPMMPQQQPAYGPQPQMPPSQMPPQPGFTPQTPPQPQQQPPLQPYPPYAPQSPQQPQPMAQPAPQPNPYQDNQQQQPFQQPQPQFPPQPPAQQPNPQQFTPPPPGFTPGQ